MEMVEWEVELEEVELETDGGWSGEPDELQDHRGDDDLDGLDEDDRHLNDLDELLDLQDEDDFDGLWDGEDYHLNDEQPSLQEDEDAQ